MDKSASAFLASLTQRSQTLVRSWYWDAVLVPFAITRLIYLLIAWFATYYVAFDHLYVERGFFLTPYRLLDIWCRWDSLNYFSIITGGYVPSANLVRLPSNVAFFPLYPYLVKSIGWILPHTPLSLYVAFGLLISNLSFLVGAGLLYKLVADRIGDETMARRTLLLLFAFPTSFIFSCFYTESLFFMLSLASLTLALSHKWFWACAAAGLLSATRPPGILIGIPLLWIYLDTCGWSLGKLRPSLAWTAIIPVPIVLHFISLYPQTGSWWAPLLAQQAWGRGTNLLANLAKIFQSTGQQTAQIDAIAAGLFLGIALIGVWRQSARYLAVYGLLQTLLPITTGTTYSFARLAVTVFPAFIILARLLKRRSVEWAVLAVFFAFQAVYFLGWVNYYWID